MKKTIKPIERLHGEIELPGDKSISHRVVFIGSISEGKTVGKNFLNADDCLRTVKAFSDMGIDIDVKGKSVFIAGNGLTGLRKPSKELYLGNSGTTMRILPGILAGQALEATLTGDASLSKRPMKRIIEPLRKMGIDIDSKNKDGFPPLVVKGGRVLPIEYATGVASAQVKSCILFAGLYAQGTSSITEPFASRDHTERMLKFFGANVSRKNLTSLISGKGSLSGKEFFIPGDISSAAFFIAGACLLQGSDITIRDIGLNPTRIGFLNALQKMGADITVTNRKDSVEPYGDIRIKHKTLKPTVIEEKEIPLLIDEVPILAVLAAATDGKTDMHGISELRVKETDRIYSITDNLKRMGVDVKVQDTRLTIKGGKNRFVKSKLQSFKDHRTAMAMAIASLYAEGECEIDDVDCINTSFPIFFELLDTLKA